MRPVYDRMYDGLHFSRDQVVRLASEINRYGRDRLLKVIECSTQMYNIQYILYILLLKRRSR